MEKEFTVRCKNCGRPFTVIEDEDKFPIKEDMYYCCRHCANSRHHSEETKNKIKNSVLKHYNSFEVECKCCGKKYIVRRLKTDLSFDKENFICKRCKKNMKKRKTNRGILKGRQEFNSDAEYYKYLFKKDKRKYYCGSKELDEQYTEISSRHSPNWFIKFIPFGFDITSVFTERIIEEYYRVKNLLYDEYINNHMSPASIYKKYNCSKEFLTRSETLLQVFRLWKFPIRGHSEAVINAILNGDYKCFPQTHFYSGWHTTWNNKKVYLRSSYEFDFAKELDEKQINYDVEFKHIKYWDSIKQIYRCAIPDFFIPSINTIVEIKSEYTLNVQNMKDKFKTYQDLGYNTILICEHRVIDLYSDEDIKSLDLIENRHKDVNAENYIESEDIK